MRIEVAGEVPPIQHTSEYVVYDVENGRIAHIHHHVQLQGARPTPEEGLESAALEAARQHHDVTRLRILAVPAEQLEVGPEVGLRVDVASQRLVEEPGGDRRVRPWLSRRSPLVYLLVGVAGGLIGGWIVLLLA